MGNRNNKKRPTKDCKKKTRITAAVGLCLTLYMRIV